MAATNGGYVNNYQSIALHEIDPLAGNCPVNLAHIETFELGPLMVVPCELYLGAEGQRIHIEPKVMQVLITLARTPGTVFSRDDLINCVWEGRIVGDASVNRVLSLLRSAIRELVGNAVQIETLPKVGYRLLLEDRGKDAPISANSLGPATDQSRSIWRPLPTSRRRLAAALVAFFLALGVAAMFWMLRTPALESVRIVMVPMETDKATDHFFALGLSSELQTELARYRGIEVTRSESARQLAGQGMQPSEIGAVLKADFVLRTRIVADVDRTLMRAELVSTNTGLAEWSDDLASSHASAQMLPERVSRKVVMALGLPVLPKKSRPQLSSSDYALYVSAMGLIRSREVEPRIAARSILEQLVERNPRSAQALAGLSKAYFLFPTDNFKSMMDAHQLAHEFARKALTIDRNSVEALKVVGSLADSDEERLEALSQATRLDPGDAEAWWWLAMAQKRPEDLSDATKSITRVVALDPLWVRASSAIEVVPTYGHIDLAIALERDVAAAAVFDWQRQMSAANSAKWSGDFSEYLRLRDLTELQMSDSERWTYRATGRAVRRLLDLPMVGAAAISFHPFVDAVEEGKLPSADQIRNQNLSPETFWHQSSGIWLNAPALFLRDNRHEELLVLYDAAFDNFAAYRSHFNIGRLTDTGTPRLSLYLAEAFDRAGRVQDAQQHRALAAQLVDRWKEADSPFVAALLNEATLSVVQHDDENAVAKIEQLIEIGWPFTVRTHEEIASGPLLDDPLWQRLQSDPRLQKILEPVRSRLAQERREYLALSKS